MSGSKRGRSLAEVMAPIEDDAAGPDALRSTAPAGEASGPVVVGRAEPEAQPTENGAQAVVPVNILVAPEDRRRLRQLSLDANLSLQKLGHEAWNLLLQKRGLPPLKPVSANVPSGRSTTGRSRA